MSGGPGPKRGAASSRKGGRRPVPRGVLELRGTSRADRLLGMPDLPNREPPVPDHVAAIPRALAEWRRIVPILENARILSESDAQILASYCVTHAAVVEATLLIAKDGFFKDGLLHPVYGAMERAMRENQRQMLELGLTPAARRGLVVTPADKDDKKDPFGVNKPRALPSGDT